MYIYDISSLRVNIKRTVSSYLSNRFKIDFHRGIIGGEV